MSDPNLFQQAGSFAADAEIDSTAGHLANQSRSLADRLEFGNALRKSVPLSGHREWFPTSDRQNPIELLEISSQGRIPELIPIRYGRMLASPFTFLRGSALIMAVDLAATPTTGIKVQVDDLRRALLDHSPQIVHFSGHGTGSDGLALTNNSGELQLVSTQSLARLFKLFKGKVECVLLNACYSEEQAQAIHENIDYVIGMSQTVGDRAAIKFAVGFYDAIGAGRSYEDAFEFGCTSIDLEGLSESETPVLKSKKSVQTDKFSGGYGVLDWYTLQDREHCPVVRLLVLTRQ